jgi:hypothetical protein
MWILVVIPLHVMNYIFCRYMFFHAFLSPVGLYSTPFNQMANSGFFPVGVVAPLVNS